MAGSVESDMGCDADMGCCIAEIEVFAVYGGGGSSLATGISAMFKTPTSSRHNLTESWAFLNAADVKHGITVSCALN